MAGVVLTMLSVVILLVLFQRPFFRGVRLSGLMKVRGDGGTEERNVVDVWAGRGCLCSSARLGLPDAAHPVGACCRGMGQPGLAEHTR